MLHQRFSLVATGLGGAHTDGPWVWLMPSQQNTSATLLDEPTGVLRFVSVPFSEAPWMIGGDSGRPASTGSWG